MIERREAPFEAKRLRNARIREQIRANVRDGTFDPDALAIRFGVKVRVITSLHKLMRKPQDQKRARGGVFFNARSEGRKTGPVAVTYVAQQTCPATCPFLHAGCYAENGFIGGMITKRLNRNVDPELTLVDIARNEAAIIDDMPGDRDLRLHIVGDSPTEEGTRLIAAAAQRYIDRGGFRVWTYTHAWRNVPRAAWGAVSVLASCETPMDIIEAQLRGYATAITIETHYGKKRHGLAPFVGMPCPEQTVGVTCESCRLCTDDTRLLKAGITVEFALHGQMHVATDSLQAARSRVDN